MNMRGNGNWSGSESANCSWSMSESGSGSTNYTQQLMRADIQYNKYIAPT